MKKASVFIFLLTLSIVSASPILKFQNDNISPGETIFGTIETPDGNFAKDISQSDIQFFNGRKEIFTEYEIFYANEKYYFAIYTQNVGSFTMKINNILYKENEELKGINLEKNFIVNKNENTSEILAIKPGLFYYKEPKIKLTNLGDSEIKISFSEENKKIENLSDISLNASQSQEIKFTPTKNFTTLKIKTYKDFYVPILYNFDNQLIEDFSELRFAPELILKNLIISEDEQVNIELFNTGNDNFTNIKISSDVYFLDFSKIENISSGNIKNLTVFFSPENPGHFTGKINISFDKKDKTYSTIIPLNLFVMLEGSTPNDFQISEKTCFEMNGTVCSSKETCGENGQGNSTWSKGGEYCCLNNCELIKNNETTSSTWLIGIAIVIIILIIIYFLYKKSKKAKPQKPEEKIKEISENYSKRISGSLSRV